MNDLIKRISDAKEMIERKPNQSTVDYTIYGVLTDCDIMLKSQQAEIKRLQPNKGKWIEIESQTGVGAFGFNEVTVNAFRCSVCRKKIDVSDGSFKYCPYCGAQMDNLKPT